MKLVHSTRYLLLSSFTTIPFLNFCSASTGYYTQETPAYGQGTYQPRDANADNHDNSISDSIYELKQLVSRLAEATSRNSEDVITRLTYTEDQMVTMQRSLEALRTEQIQRTDYIQSELNYLTGRDDSLDKFNVTSSTARDYYSSLLGGKIKISEVK